MTISGSVNTELSVSCVPLIGVQQVILKAWLTDSPLKVCGVPPWLILFMSVCKREIGYN